MNPPELKGPLKDPSEPLQVKGPINVLPLAPETSSVQGSTEIPTLEGLDPPQVQGPTDILTSELPVAYQIDKLERPVRALHSEPPNIVEISQEPPKNKETVNGSEPHEIELPEAPKMKEHTEVMHDSKMEEHAKVEPSEAPKMEETIKFMHLQSRGHRNLISHRDEESLQNITYSESYEVNSSVSDVLEIMPQSELPVQCEPLAGSESVDMSPFEKLMQEGQVKVPDLVLCSNEPSISGPKLSSSESGEPMLLQPVLYATLPVVTEMPVPLTNAPKSRKPFKVSHSILPKTPRVEEMSPLCTPESRDPVNVSLPNTPQPVQVPSSGMISFDSRAPVSRHLSNLSPPQVEEPIQILPSSSIPESGELVYQSETPLVEGHNQKSCPLGSGGPVQVPSGSTEFGGPVQVPSGSKNSSPEFGEPVQVSSSDVMPDPTETPSSDLMPDPTETPSSDVMPDPTETPSSDVMPDPTETPSSDVMPDPTETPSSDVMPDPTETPSSDVMPDLTETPSSDVMPDPTETPSSDVMPDPTETPSSDVMPDPTETPSSDVMPDPSKLEVWHEGSQAKEMQRPPPEISQSVHTHQTELLGTAAMDCLHSHSEPQSFQREGTIPSYTIQQIPMNREKPKDLTNLESMEDPQLSMSGPVVDEKELTNAEPQAPVLLDEEELTSAEHLIPAEDLDVVSLAIQDVPVKLPSPMPEGLAGSHPELSTTKEKLKEEASVEPATLTYVEEFKSQGLNHSSSSNSELNQSFLVDHSDSEFSPEVERSRVIANISPPSLLTSETCSLASSMSPPIPDTIHIFSVDRQYTEKSDDVTELESASNIFEDSTPLPAIPVISNEEVEILSPTSEPQVVSGSVADDSPVVPCEKMKDYNLDLEPVIFSEPVGSIRSAHKPVKETADPLLQFRTPTEGDSPPPNVLETNAYSIDTTFVDMELCYTASKSRENVIINSLSSAGDGLGQSLTNIAFPSNYLEEGLGLPGSSSSSEFIMVSDHPNPSQGSSPAKRRSLRLSQRVSESHAAVLQSKTRYNLKTYSKRLSSSVSPVDLSPSSHPSTPRKSLNDVVKKLNNKMAVSASPSTSSSTSPQKSDEIGNNLGSSQGNETETQQKNEPMTVGEREQIDISAQKKSLQLRMRRQSRKTSDDIIITDQSDGISPIYFTENKARRKRNNGDELVLASTDAKRRCSGLRTPTLTKTQILHQDRSVDPEETMVVSIPLIVVHRVSENPTDSARKKSSPKLVISYSKLKIPSYKLISNTESVNSVPSSENNIQNLRTTNQDESRTPFDQMSDECNTEPFNQICSTECHLVPAAVQESDLEQMSEPQATVSDKYQSASTARPTHFEKESEVLETIDNVLDEEKSEMLQDEVKSEVLLDEEKSEMLQDDATTLKSEVLLDEVEVLQDEVKSEMLQDDATTLKSEVLLDEVKSEVLQDDGSALGEEKSEMLQDDESALGEEKSEVLQGDGSALDDDCQSIEMEMCSPLPSQILSFSQTTPSTREITPPPPQLDRNNHLEETPPPTNTTSSPSSFLSGLKDLGNKVKNCQPQKPEALPEYIPLIPERDSISETPSPIHHNAVSKPVLQSLELGMSPIFESVCPLSHASSPVLSPLTSVTPSNEDLCPQDKSPLPSSLADPVKSSQLSPPHLLQVSSSDTILTAPKQSSGSLSQDKSLNSDPTPLFPKQPSKSLFRDKSPPLSTPNSDPAAPGQSSKSLFRDKSPPLSTPNQVPAPAPLFPISQDTSSSKLSSSNPVPLFPKKTPLFSKNLVQSPSIVPQNSDTESCSESQDEADPTRHSVVKNPNNKKNLSTILGVLTNVQKALDHKVEPSCSNASNSWLLTGAPTTSCVDDGTAEKEASPKELSPVSRNTGQEQPVSQTTSKNTGQEQPVSQTTSDSNSLPSKNTGQEQPVSQTTSDSNSLPSKNTGQEQPVSQTNSDNSLPSGNRHIEDTGQSRREGMKNSREPEDEKRKSISPIRYDSAQLDEIKRSKVPSLIKYEPADSSQFDEIKKVRVTSWSSQSDREPRGLGRRPLAASLDLDYIQPPPRRFHPLHYDNHYDNHYDDPYDDPYDDQWRYHHSRQPIHDSPSYYVPPDPILPYGPIPVHYEHDHSYPNWHEDIPLYAEPMEYRYRYLLRPSESRYGPYSQQNWHPVYRQYRRN